LHSEKYTSVGHKLSTTVHGNKNQSDISELPDEWKLRC
jgi:hypothetical protein